MKNNRKLSGVRRALNWPKAEPLNILIVHGVDGYPAKSWYGWLEKKLSAEGHNVVVPQFPTQLPPAGAALLPFPDQVPEKLQSYKQQTLEEWTKVAQEAMKGWDPAHTILVGHSLGGLTVLRLAEMASKPYHAVFSVSPVGGDIGIPELQPGLESFYRGIDWAKVRAGAKQFAAFFSYNDNVVPYQQSRNDADRSGAKVVTIPGGNHLNADSGFDAKQGFPALRRSVMHAIGKRISPASHRL